MRVKCLAQEHNTMSPARARTRTASLLKGDRYLYRLYSKIMSELSVKEVLFLFTTEGKRRRGSGGFESERRQIYTGTSSTLMDTQRAGCLSRRWVLKLLIDVHKWTSSEGSLVLAFLSSSFFLFVFHQQICFDGGVSREKPPHLRLMKGCFVSVENET